MLGPHAASCIYAALDYALAYCDILVNILQHVGDIMCTVSHSLTIDKGII